MVTKRVVLEYQYAIMIEKCDGHAHQATVQWSSLRSLDFIVCH